MRVSRITIGRLYNLGSYEHVRYELSVEVAEGESAATAILGMEKIIAALSPKTSTHTRYELERERVRVEELKASLAAMTDEDYFRRNHGHFEGTPAEYVARVAESHAENLSRREAWEERAEKARKMLDDLGGSAVWKDAKLDWEDNDFYE